MILPNEVKTPFEWGFDSVNTESHSAPGTEWLLLGSVVRRWDAGCGGWPRGAWQGRRPAAHKCPQTDRSVVLAPLSALRSASPEGGVREGA